LICFQLKLFKKVSIMHTKHKLKNELRNEPETRQRTKQAHQSSSERGRSSRKACTQVFLEYKIRIVGSEASGPSV